jgi:RNA polymerase sigma-70 factor (ECF subfamily)
MTWEELEALYVRYSRSVYRRARELLADEEAARDATQEVFMRVIRAQGKLPFELTPTAPTPTAPTPTAWLHVVTTNFCLNQLRDRSRRQALLTSKYAPGGDVAPAGESRAILLEILNRVPEDLQDIAVYFFLDELTYDEIAALVGVSRRTVCNRLAAFRAVVDALFPKVGFAS